MKPRQFESVDRFSCLLSKLHMRLRSLIAGLRSPETLGHDDDNDDDARDDVDDDSGETVGHGLCAVGHPRPIAFVSFLRIVLPMACPVGLADDALAPVVLGCPVLFLTCPFVRKLCLERLRLGSEERELPCGRQ